MLRDKIIRAWKDPDFRTSLSEEDLAELPENPAGAIELTDEELDMATGGSWGGNSQSASTRPASYSASTRPASSSMSNNSTSNNSSSASNSSSMSTPPRPQPYTKRNPSYSSSNSQGYARWK